MRWVETVHMGVKGLLLRRLRTALSTLGIVFGVAAVVSMMSIGEGARREAVRQIELLGTNNLRIRQLELTGEQLRNAQAQASLGLTHEDAKVLASMFPERMLLAPMRFVEAELRHAGRQIHGQIIGVTETYADVTSFHVGRGRPLTPVDVDDSKKVCVLGAEIAREAFGRRDPVGESVQIGRDAFAVIGVMEARDVREGRAAVIKVRNINRDVYVPLTTAMRRFPGSGTPTTVQEIAVRVADANDLTAAAQQIDRLLTRRHRGVRDYEILIPEELLAQAQRTQRLFNVIMGSIAGISLLVGGIGIMNIMLANVSERTREIGVRRAIGASRDHILQQFLTEAILVCLAGGGLGVVVGFVMAQTITLVAGWQTGFSLISVLLAFGTAAAVGLGFGLLPARRAAEKSPVEALRTG